MTPTPPGSNSSPNWCRRCPQIQDTTTGNPAFLTEVSQNPGHLLQILRLNPQARAMAQVPRPLPAQVPLLPEQVPSAGGAGPPSSGAGAFCWWRRSPSSGAGPPFFRRRPPSSGAGLLFSWSPAPQIWRPRFPTAQVPSFFSDLRQTTWGPAPLGRILRDSGRCRPPGRRAGIWPTGWNLADGPLFVTHTISANSTNSCAPNGA
jgi:hypothetical protein